MKITKDSHVDHALTTYHTALIMAMFGDRQAFFIETVELPADVAELPCGLHGPVTGSAPVPDSECLMVVRGDRKGPSRLCNRPATLTNKLTVIGGMHEGACILYTAFGGPQAPREPWDESLTDIEREVSKAFWADHALSA